MIYSKTKTDYFYKKGNNIIQISQKSNSNFKIKKVAFIPNNAVKSSQKEFDTVFNNLLK